MINSVADQAHAGIRGLHAYVPGKPIEELRRELGLESIIKLASNENPLGTSPAARAALAGFDGDLYRYPDGGGVALKADIAARHGVEVDRVTLGNGSNDILELTARVFLGPGKNAVMSRYAFAVYPIVARAVDAEVRIAPALGVESSMPRGHDLAAIARRIDGDTGVVFLASPNNPTGTWLDNDALEAFIGQVPAQTVIVLDQAYIEYQTDATRPDVQAWLVRYPNLIVTRTFSKVYGMAALRFGYGLSSALVGDYLNRIRQPFNVNMLAMHCAHAALGDDDFIERSVTGNREQRVMLTHELSARGLCCLPSQANFVTFDCGRACTPLFEALLREGVIVRALASYELPEHLRVTIGTKEENQRFLDALDRVLEQA